MPERPLAPALRPFDAVGGWTIGVVESLGRFAIFFLEALAALATPPFKWRAFLDRINFIGYRSLLIILLIHGSVNQGHIGGLMVGIALVEVFALYVEE